MPSAIQNLKTEGQLNNAVDLAEGLLLPSLRYFKITSVSAVALCPNIIPAGLLEFVVERGDIEFEIGSLPTALRLLGLPDGFTRSFSTITEILATSPDLVSLVLENLHSSNELSVNPIPSTVKCSK